MTKELFISACACLILAQAMAAGTATAKEAGPEPGVKIDVRKKIAAVDDRFWGTNFLFWIEDDESLADGAIEQRLREMPCNVLRYPGGTVADNFHWRTNMLDNNSMFPYEEGPAESDFEEFMAFCGRVGAEPILVVNTQSWVIKGDVEGGARDAAAWVSYCREKGHRVKYWEIGNETYWHPFMTAREYGRVAKAYAREMKKADPSILVSVNGAWDINFVGTKERIDPSLWDTLLEMNRKIVTRDDYSAATALKDSVTVTPWTTGDDKWWAGLMEECGDQIDAISVHWYYHNNTTRHIDHKLNELREYLRGKSGKTYPIWLTEYNCNEGEAVLRGAGLAEGLGRFLNADIELSCFWPFRIGGSGNRSMLSMEGKEPQYPYQVFLLFARNLKGNMVACDSGDDLYTFASDSPKQTTIVVSGRSLKKEETARIEVELPAHSTVSATSYRVGGKNDLVLRESPAAVSVSPEGTIGVAVEPQSFVMITIKKQ